MCTHKHTALQTPHAQSHADVALEAHAARNKAIVLDQSYFGKFLVSGPDANRLMDWLCTNDVTHKLDGTVTYTNMLNARGGVECDLTVTYVPLSSLSLPLLWVLFLSVVLPSPHASAPVALSLASVLPTLRMQGVPM